MPARTADLVRRQSPFRSKPGANVAIASSVYPFRESSLIRRQLEELNAEWDIERALEANAATITPRGYSGSTVPGFTGAGSGVSNGVCWC